MSKHQQLERLRKTLKFQGTIQIVVAILFILILSFNCIRALIYSSRFSGSILLIIFILALGITIFYSWAKIGNAFKKATINEKFHDNLQTAYSNGNGLIILFLIFSAFIILGSIATQLL